MGKSLESGGGGRGNANIVSCPGGLSIFLLFLWKG